MQIRLSSQFENECAWSVGRPMTTGEFLARFPEVPRDLTDEPILPVYVQLFGPLLCVGIATTSPSSVATALAHPGHPI